MLALPTDYPSGVELETQPCPNGCLASDEPVMEGSDRLHGLGGVFRVVRCQRCGLMRTDPRPTAATIGAYYPDDYGPYQSSKVASPRIKPRRWHHRVKGTLARWLSRDARRLPPLEPGHLLEVGCASGAYLQELKSKGWTVEGIEYAETAAEAARDAGLSVQTGSVESAHAPARTPDVIAAWMVLEHLHEPVDALRRMRAWVQPDGWLVGVVPDASAFDRRWFGNHWHGLHLPNHLYHYDPASLRQILQRGGWNLVHLRWQPNEQNLLRTLDSWLGERHHPRAQRALQWFKNSRGARRWRRHLGWLLGLSHQSGRMEFWARPMREAPPLASPSDGASPGPHEAPR